MKLKWSSIFRVFKIAYKIVQKLDEVGVVEIKELGKIKKIEDAVKVVVKEELGLPHN